MQCSCGTKSFLHLANCASVQERTKRVLYILAEDAFANPNSNIFYVAATDEAAIAMYKDYIKSLGKEDYMFCIETNSVNSVTMSNGAEVTFLPESEALSMVDLPPSKRIYFESTNATKDLMEALALKTENITAVDAITKELL